MHEWEPVAGDTDAVTVDRAVITSDRGPVTSDPGPGRSHSQLISAVCGASAARGGHARMRFNCCRMRKSSTSTATYQAMVGTTKRKGMTENMGAECNAAPPELSTG